ncbi:MAG: hypothetical protein GY946_02685 [bacterium]|nr:hypothetical protein [bacterium]
MIAAATPPYLVLLLLTIAIETAVAFGLMWKHRRRLRFDVPLLNCVTHPTATVLLRWGLLPFWPAEILIWVAEAFGYRTVTGLSTRRALALSGACNAVTVFISLAWL